MRTWPAPRTSSLPAWTYFRGRILDPSRITRVSILLANLELLQARDLITELLRADHTPQQRI